MVLDVSEYDISYFDGQKTTYRHNAGYSRYERWKRKEGINSLGEFWLDKAKEFIDTHNLNGKKVLEIGCAKGFVVKDLRDLGVDAYGLDVSSYAIGECEPEVVPYLTIGDARTELSKYKNKEFDLVFSLRFLECIPEADLPALISELNRISKYQFHFIDEFVGAKSGAGIYYLNHPLSWWRDLNWSKGTLLVSQENQNNKLTK